MDKIFIFLLVFLAIFICFMLGIIGGIYLALKATKDLEEPDDEEKFDHLYCFQCEMEMSTKEKNGRLYCANCGLRH